MEVTKSPVTVANGESWDRGESGQGGFAIDATLRAVITPWHLPVTIGNGHALANRRTNSNQPASHPSVLDRLAHSFDGNTSTLGDGAHARSGAIGDRDARFGIRIRRTSPVKNTMPRALNGWFERSERLEFATEGDFQPCAGPSRRNASHHVFAASS
jgi:hypothetical protein